MPKKLKPKKMKTGRPRNDAKHLAIEQAQPWKKLKVSRRTYYRWKKAGKRV
jgi:hypothetical protein